MLVAVIPIFELCPRTQWGHSFMESHSNLVYFVCLIWGLGCDHDNFHLNELWPLRISNSGQLGTSLPASFLPPSYPVNRSLLVILSFHQIKLVYFVCLIWGLGSDDDDF